MPKCKFLVGESGRGKGEGGVSVRVAEGDSECMQA